MSKVGATVNLYDPKIDSTNYETTTLVVIDTSTAEHKVVKEIGKNSYDMLYQPNGTLTVIDTGVKTYTLRQFDGALSEIGTQDLTKLSGITGDIVDTDLQLINGKVYIEITTKTDKTFKTFIYNYDDKQVLTEFLIAEDADVKVLKHE